jgi:hypothetical protein
MSNYLTNMQLSIIDNLFQQKQNELNQLSGNLQIADVKEDDRFEVTVKRIKQQLLLEPIVFDEPRLNGHYQTTRNVPPNYHNMWGGPQDVFMVSVLFPFTGSPELLSYRPHGLQVPIGHIYQAYGSSIDIELTLIKLDKAEALAKAKEEMHITITFAEANSNQAVQWAVGFEPVIDNTLNLRRKELIAFYS